VSQPIVSPGSPDFPAADRLTEAKIVLPIGCYVGELHRDVGAPVDHHSIRIGWDMWPVQDAGLQVWALAHGLPGIPDSLPWTLQRWQDLVSESGIPEAAKEIADLIDRDLVIEVSLGTEETVQFAQDVRLRSLLMGLGNSIEDQFTFALGLPGAQPAVLVSGLPYSLWQWAHGCDNLWDACLVLAEAGRMTGSTTRSEIEPEPVLTRVLLMVQFLLAHGAVYLDEAAVIE
jgi:hypothetical protein